VIVTVSLGVLKAQHRTLFTPNLPPQKITAIQKYGFGTLGKIFLKFETPFWPVNNSDFLSYSFLWSDADKKEILNTDKAWLLGIMFFVKVDSFPNLLEAFYTGVFMKNFESFNDQKIIDDCMWMLEKFLGKKLPKPSYMNRTKWLTNKYFLGSYSYLSYGLEQSKISPDELGKPVKKSNGKGFLHFAGEATDLKFPSYAHGAILSGYRAATEVMSS
jgi:monoamine oxidase